MKIKYLMLRLFELFVPSAALSSLICGFSNHIPSDTTAISILLSLCVIVFGLINALGLRNLYTIIGYKKPYYIVSLTAYAIFMVFNAAVYLLSSEVYVWIFLPTKFLHFAVPFMRNWMSAGVFHILMLALVPLMCAAKIKTKPADTSKLKKLGLRSIIASSLEKADRKKHRSDDDYGIRRRKRSHAGSWLKGLLFYRKNDKY